MEGSQVEAAVTPQELQDEQLARGGFGSTVNMCVSSSISNSPPMTDIRPSFTLLINIHFTNMNHFKLVFKH